MPRLIEAAILDDSREKSIHVKLKNGKEAFLSRKLVEIVYNRNETYYFKVVSWYAKKLGLEEFGYVKVPVRGEVRNTEVAYAL